MDRKAEAGSLANSLTDATPLPAQLLNRNITHVVSITNNDISLPSTSLQHLHIRLEDENEADLSGHFGTIFTFMREAISGHKAVLVHCEAGISRSATTVIAYLVKYHEMSLLEAYQHTKERRRIINPNTGFVTQLRRFAISINPEKELDAVPFVLYWLRSSMGLLREAKEDEVRKAWIDSNGDLSTMWQALHDLYEDRLLFPVIKRQCLKNIDPT